MKRGRGAACSGPSPKSAKLVDGSPSCKVLFVLVDGVADVAIPELDHLTTLQAAHTPHMDLIAGEQRSRLQERGEKSIFKQK